MLMMSHTALKSVSNSSQSSSSLLLRRAGRKIAARSRKSTTFYKTGKAFASSEEGGEGKEEEEWAAMGSNAKSNVVPRKPTKLAGTNAPEYMHGVLAFNRFYPENARGDTFNRHLLVALDKGVKESAKVTEWVVDNIYRPGDLLHLVHVSDPNELGGYMLPPDGLWTYDSAIARYNAADRAAQSKFWDNELKSTENMLQDIVEQTHEYVEQKHEKGLSLREDIPQPAIELDALLNVQYQSTSDVIVSKAEQVNAAMIIVVKHDKGWLTRLIEGQSISSNVEKKSKIPVLVYHAGHMLTKEEELEVKEKESRQPGGKHASQTKL